MIYYNYVYILNEMTGMRCQNQIFEIFYAFNYFAKRFFLMSVSQLSKIIHEIIQSDVQYDTEH